MVRLNTVLLPGGDAGGAPGEGQKQGDSRSPATATAATATSTRTSGTQIARRRERPQRRVHRGDARSRITNCLNFGNPEKPGIFWQFCQAVEGLAEGCRQLDTPVVGGNVSFYNESFGEAIYPTPVIGMLGVLEDVERRVGSAFQGEGDTWCCSASTADELGGSEYLKVFTEKVAGKPPSVDWEAEKALIEVPGWRRRRRELLRSAHDLSEGGLAVALAESCMQGGIGADLYVGELPGALPTHVVLFSESQSRALVSVTPAMAERLEELAGRHGVHYAALGRTGGDRLEVKGAFALDLSELTDLYENSLERMIAGAHH